MELSLIDKSTGEALELPEFLSTSRKFAMLDVRASLRAGMAGWKLQPFLEDMGTTIDISILNFKEFLQIRPSEEYATPSDFLQFIAFIHPNKLLKNGSLATVTFGGSSVKDGIALTSYFGAMGVNPLAKIVTLGMKEVANTKKQKFNVITFATSDAEKAQLTLVAEALEAMPTAVYSFRDIQNIDAK